MDRRNPFATRHVRPGRLAARDETGNLLDVDALASRARELGIAAIRGPHGAGKTTLLVALAGALESRGLLAGFVRPRSGLDALAVLRAVGRARPGATLCVDSWESLGPVRAAVVRWVARRRRVGLLVTSHRAAGMPPLVHCATTPGLLARLVADLPDHGGLVGDTDIVQAFTTHRGNLREALYDLYDRFERRWRTVEPGSTATPPPHRAAISAPGTGEVPQPPAIARP